MKKKTLKAIKDSIKHWERIAAFKEGEIPNSYQCALCQAFPTCIDCPVAIKTGQDLCEGTPYDDALISFEDCDDINYDDTLKPKEIEKRKKRLAKDANKQIKFLKSLLPNEEK